MTENTRKQFTDHEVEASAARTPYCMECGTDIENHPTRQLAERAKMTVGTAQVKKGDFVVGYNQVVTQVDIDRWRVAVTFENGERWLTSSHFETTILRGNQ